MNKSNLLKWSVLGALVAAGFAGGCSDSQQVFVPDEDPTAGAAGKKVTGGAGKAGESQSAAGDSSMMTGAAGEPETGVAGAVEEGGEAGALVTAGTGGTAGSSGSSGSGGTLAGSGGTAGSIAGGGGGGKAGAGGTGGTSGSAGAAGKGGTGGTSGAGAGGGGTGGGSTGGGGTGGGGTSGSAGSAGAAQALFVPASSTCTSGNVNAAFSVCRNCHTNPLAGGAPVPLLTFADIKIEADTIASKLGGNLMPPPGSGFSISSANKLLITNWIAAGSIGVSNAACP